MCVKFIKEYFAHIYMKRFSFNFSVKWHELHAFTNMLSVIHHTIIKCPPLYQGQGVEALFLILAHTGIITSLHYSSQIDT